MTPPVTTLVDRARAANTHRVCYAGVLLGALALGAIGGRAPMDAYVTLHVHHFAGILRAYIDGAADVGLWVAWPAIVAAALGRPPTVPK